MNAKKVLYGLAVVGIWLNVVSFAGAEVMFSGVYSQDFDSITTAPPSNWIAGNYASLDSRVDPPNSKIIANPLVADDGSSATKATSYSYGTTGSSDRAIGHLPTTSGYGDAGLQVAMSNNMGAPITRIGIEYTGEQWRDYQGTSDSGPEKLRVYISNLDDGNFVYLPTLDFVAPQNAGLNAALDGNNPANRETLSATIDLAAIGYSGGAIAPGESFYITWHDWNDLNTNDHALAVDDVRITGVPEPSTFAMFALFGLLGGVNAWRKRKRA